ncbi:MAG: dihydrofolate reductase family protein [Candidatus Thermoplasmatota archaeon]|nr:dihydrofolate reductase family protein [Candidatus Thermoplasmatota archaeon]
MLRPLETLLEDRRAPLASLPAELAKFYGPFPSFPRTHHPYVIANFASTLDGVVSFGDRPTSGGSDISGNSIPDRAVMGILRSLADAVVVGAGTLRTIPRHRWTPGQIYPPSAAAYRTLRAETGRTGEPLNVIITAGGKLDLSAPVFSSGEVTSLVVTTVGGRNLLLRQKVPPSTTVVSAGKGKALRAKAILEVLARHVPRGLILLEGGPHLLGTFLGEGLLDELFLTLSPQLAGHSSGDPTIHLIEGTSFGLADPRWCRLVGVKRAENHLFLRYRFSGDSRA